MAKYNSKEELVRAFAKKFPEHEDCANWMRAEIEFYEVMALRELVDKIDWLKAKIKAMKNAR